MKKEQQQDEEEKAEKVEEFDKIEFKISTNATKLKIKTRTYFLNIFYFIIKINKAVTFPNIFEEKQQENKNENNTPTRKKVLERKSDEVSPIKKASISYNSKGNGNVSPGKKSIGKKQK